MPQTEMMTGIIRIDSYGLFKFTCGLSESLLPLVKRSQLGVGPTALRIKSQPPVQSLLGIGPSPLPAVDASEQAMGLSMSRFQGDCPFQLRRSRDESALFFAENPQLDTDAAIARIKRHDLLKKSLSLGGPPLPAVYPRQLQVRPAMVLVQSNYPFQLLGRLPEFTLLYVKSAQFEPDASVLRVALQRLAPGRLGLE